MTKGCTTAFGGCFGKVLFVVFMLVVLFVAFGLITRS